MASTDFDTKRISEAPDAIAPDGAEVRLLSGLSRGGMATFTLMPGAVSKAVAHRTIEEAQIIRLAAKDQRALAEATLNPPAPTLALVRAAKTYRALVKASR